MKRIPVAGPSITQREIDYVTEAVRTAWYGNANVFHERFERAFAAHCGRRHAVSLPSCTSGLHLALLALGIGPGDEVIVPDATWIASVAPVRYVGATPVFADIDARSWGVSPQSFADLITPHTKAAIVVDLYGSMPDWDELAAIAGRRGVSLIEDAAEAVGSRWRDRPAGSFGVMSAFSFHGSKTLTTGEGGMLVLDDDALLDRVLRLRDHGRAPGDFMFFNEEVGWKYKMSSMQAALGLAQLERLDELLADRARVAGLYGEALAGIDGLELPCPDADGDRRSWFVYVVQLPRGADRDVAVEAMRERGVDTKPYLPAIHLMSFYRERFGHREGEFPVCEDIAARSLALPFYPELGEGEVEQVAAALRAVVETPVGGRR
jgi:perosamine synthetase